MTGNKSLIIAMVAILSIQISRCGDNKETQIQKVAPRREDIEVHMSSMPSNFTQAALFLANIIKQSMQEDFTKLTREIQETREYAKHQFDEAMKIREEAAASVAEANVRVKSMQELCDIKIQAAQASEAREKAERVKAEAAKNTEFKARVQAEKRASAAEAAKTYAETDLKVCKIELDAAKKVNEAQLKQIKALEEIIQALEKTKEALKQKMKCQEEINRLIKKL